ncbi:MAG: VCBS repeat-containing protein [Planctomycetes bacterium]|nr:VCBS repeat-containing protein [Planctomycetota bacterium]
MIAIPTRIVTAFALSVCASTVIAQTTYNLTHRFRNGEAVIPVGDVSGDTHPDFLVGEPTAGEVYLVSGRSFETLKTWTAPQQNSGFGNRLAAHDINKDGALDFVVTAPNDQGGKGAFYLIDGKTLSIVNQGIGNGGTFGHSVCFADVYPFIPDGIPEVVVGAPSQPSATQQSVGEVRIYEVKNFNATFVGASSGSAGGDRYGECVASNGDLDGRTGDELVITAKGSYSSLGGCAGGYFVVKNATTTIRVNGPTRVCFGSAVLIDDVDNDNMKEILVGCGFNNRTSQAELYDFNTATSLWTQTRTINPNPYIPNMGMDVIRVPDLNSDGIDDIAFAGTEDVQFWSGRSFLPIGGFQYSPTYFFSRPQLAYFGDLDKDGVFEIGVGTQSGSVPAHTSNVQIWSQKRWSFTPADNYLNATRGGTVEFALDAGPAYAGQLYMTIGTLSGLGTPKQFGNAVGAFELNFGPFTALLPNLVNYGPFINWLGFLDSNGKATVTPRWSSGNVAQYAPLPMHLQVLVIDYTKPDFSFLTNQRHFFIR